MYQEIDFSNQNAGLFEAIWCFKSTQPVVKSHVVPDGCFDIIFDLSLGQSYISGVMSMHADIDIPAGKHMVGIRIRTEFFQFFSKVPAYELRNLKVETSEVIDQIPINQLLASLGCTHSLQEQATSLASTLEITKAKIDLKEKSVIQAAAWHCRQNPTIVNTESLATDLAISPRQLQRKFKENLGLTLKEFTGVLRFQNAIKRLKEDHSRSLLQIAFDCGYYDHAHISNHFKKLSGKTPSFYR
ncbi:MAG: helix-turn-helix domain-containing protein [Bacteroidota bacterium]